MSQLSNKITVRNLIEISAAKKIKNVVSSPGSRNAPLNISFNEHPAFSCYVVPDERSAAFIALGISQQTHAPTIIHCTSGSAALNYAPAVAEAYYQKIPMLIITADRPEEWIGQGEGQAIYQKDIYRNYIAQSYHLHLDTQDEDHERANFRMICEAIDKAIHERLPVHINIPFREPLYDVCHYKDIPFPKVIDYFYPTLNLSTSQWEQLNRQFIFDKILIICGLCPRDNSLNQALNELGRQNIVILAETTSNIQGENIYNNIDALVHDMDKEQFAPQLLLTIGHSFISKKLKLWLRASQPKEHWHIAEDEAQDVFQALTKHIPVRPTLFFEKINSEKLGISPSYKKIWEEKHRATQNHLKTYLSKAEWSDFKAFSVVLPVLPPNTQLQMGNSSPVRYIQLFPMRNDISYYANRGVSGIDGSTSTAVGSSLANPNPTVLITGDIAFFYDSNAFWNHHLPSHLRVIVINNQGGGIFRLIKGPKSTNILSQCFETTQEITAQELCKTFGVSYYQVSDENTLTDVLPTFFAPQEDNNPAVLEIQTPRMVNDVVFKNYFNTLADSF